MNPLPNPSIARQRMIHQQLLQPVIDSPAEVVRWMGAVQAQDYPAAKWAVAQRAQVTEPAVDQAVSDGEILRLHVMRPTWHLVAAQDVPWLVALTGPRVVKNLAGRYRQLALDEDTLAHSQDVFREALAGGRQLTKSEMETALHQAGIPTDIPQRFVHLLVHAELTGVICSGDWQGKQNTYALLDERVPAAVPFERDAALAELTRRYFTSHGPATLKDFSWWSGLTLTDARAGIQLVGASLESEEIDGTTYWSLNQGSLPAVPTAPDEPVAHLLPNYDEYVVAYTDRSAIFDLQLTRQLQLSNQLHMRGGILSNVILINGLVVGRWSQKIVRNEILLKANLLLPLSAPEQQALQLAVQQYEKFHGKTVKYLSENYF